MVMAAAEIPPLDSKSHSLPKPEHSDSSSYLLDVRWMVGLSLQVVGACMDFTALGLAPASGILHRYLCTVTYTSVS